MTLELLSIASIAFIGSIGHCIGMCGGFIISYTSLKVDGDKTKLHQAFLHLLYSLGRISSYVFLGIVLTFIGEMISFTNETKGIMFVLLGIFMTLVGISFVQTINLSKYFTLNIANTNIFKSLQRRVMSSKKPISLYGFGILNGLIPCGFVYFFLSSAIASGNTFDGALIMLVFGLSTVPVLFTLGFVSSMIKNGVVQKTFSLLSAFFITGYGLFTVIKGVMIFRNMMQMQM